LVLREIDMEEPDFKQDSNIYSPKTHEEILKMLDEIKNYSYDKLSKRSRELAVSKYDWKVVANELEKYYKEFI
jgi:glycosyltransferase involved in cell wall biosynthesis